VWVHRMWHSSKVQVDNLLLSFIRSTNAIVYIVSSIAVYNKHYYMQELVLLYKASRTRVARIGGENVCECWIFTSGSNCRENSRVNAYTQKPGVISMKV